MKKITLILSLGLILFGTQFSNAQFLKKLKKKINDKVEQVEQRIENKIENKVDEKIDKTVDGTIDGIFEKNKTNPSPTENSEPSNSSEAVNKTYSGSIGLEHSQKYGSFQINSLDNLKIERTNNGYIFYGNWFSHEVDVYDGYKLGIETNENLELGKTYTFQISKNASLLLGYDPELPATQEDKGDFKRGISDEYQNYDLSSGKVKVTINKDNSFELDFSGEAAFTKRTRTANNEVSESKYTASVSGNIKGENPQFIDNKTITKNSNSKPSTASSSSTVNTSAQPAGQYVFTFETLVAFNIPDKNETHKMSYLLNPSVEYIGLKTDMSQYSDEEMAGESIIIMDGDNVHIFVETQGMKMQMSQSMMGGQQQNPTDQMENYDYSNLKKTGNTKTIFGATCYEYVMSDKQTKIQLWVAPSVNLPNWFMQNKEVLDGHILEYVVDGKEGKMIMTTLEINDNINKTVNPSEYKKMF